MRKLDEEDKQIIRDISNIKGSSIRTVSSLIAYLFKADKFALLVYDKIYILTAEGVESTPILVLMAKIMSLIDYLQNDGYLYIIPNEEYCFLQDGSNPEITINTNGDIICCGGCFVKEPCGMKIVIDNKPFVSIEIPEQFEKTLKKVVSSYVYPTTKLTELVKNDFTIGDELRYKTELKYTRIGLGISLVALFISIAAPFYMTEYNNRHSITTVDSVQINRIEQAIWNHHNKMCNSQELLKEQNTIKDTERFADKLDSHCMKSDTVR